MAKLTWHGHATWLIETGKHKVLVDPYFTDNPAAKVKSDDVACDFILITHGHEDHTTDAVKVAKRTGALVVCNWEIHLWLQNKGIKNTQPMNTGGTVKLPFGSVKMTIAHHSSSMPDGTYAGNPNGYVVTLAEGAQARRIYFAGDTSLFLDMQLYGRGGLDLAVLPIGDLFTMGVEDSIEAIKLLAPRRVAPSHYNTWPPIEQDAGAWAARVNGETKAQPIVPEVGRAIEL
jgi:L-ascorbate metabolism protein UlaG (beta-lactamase superfamily)